MIDKRKTFKRAPSLKAINNIESDEAARFIESGSAVPQPEEKKPVASKKPVTVAIVVDDEMPWMTSDPKLRTQHISRIPAPLKQLIEYLGDTTKGKNQNSITIEGLTTVATAIAKEKGVPLPDNWAQWLKSK